MLRSSLFVFIFGVLLFPDVGRSQDDDRLNFVRDIVVEAGQTSGDVICPYCSVRVRGKVTGDVVAIGGSIDVTGQVEGDCVAVGGGVRLGSGASVGGEAVALGGPLELEAQASVGRDREDLPWFFAPGQREPTWRGLLLDVGITIGLVLLGFAVLRARRVQVMASSVRNRPARTLLTGIVIAALVSLLYVLSQYLGRVEDILDWALSIFLVLAAIAGLAGLSFRLGSTTRRASTALGATFVGALLIALLQAIPIFGLVVFLVAGTLGLGCAFYSGFGRAPDWILQGFHRHPQALGASEAPPSAP